MEINPRILHWEGSRNARDLGGLRTGDGRITRFGAIVRSDTPARLTAQGWSALYDYGIRTIISLQTHGMLEDELDIHPPYADISVVQVAIEDVTDPDFRQRWASSELWSTPLYYKDALTRWPDRHAAALTAFGQTQPGGVLFHCIRGHDRTGIIALLVLALAGVTPDEILADYELSVDPPRDALLRREGTSLREAVLGALEGLDVENYLRQGGARLDDLKSVRERLLS